MCVFLCAHGAYYTTFAAERRGRRAPDYIIVCSSFIYARATATAAVERVITAAAGRASSPRARGRANTYEEILGIASATKSTQTALKYPLLGSKRFIEQGNEALLHK